MYGCELDHKEDWAPKNWCFQTVVLEKTPESLLDSKEDQTSQPLRKSTLNIHWKDWCWSWSFNTSATWCEELTHWKRPWCWVRLKAGGEGDDRGWDSWMASLSQWTWTLATSGRWWGTGKPGILQPMGVSNSRTWLGNWITAATTKISKVYEYLTPKYKNQWEVIQSLP